MKDNTKEVWGKNWERVCSSCGKTMTYSCRKSYLICQKTNSRCKRCATKESGKTKDKSYLNTEKYKKKISDALKVVRKTNSYGDKFKEKCRENKLRQIQLQGTQRTYNPLACQFIDNINHEFGWNLQHAMNGGEIQIIGYSLDGYDKDKNIVFEYDEPKHRKSVYMKKDRDRERRIINVLHPTKFVRYDEKEKVMVDVISGRRIV